MKRIILLVVGFITLGIGAVATVIPLLPSFPFLAITAVCFAKSSQRFNDWYRNSAIYKNNLESYMQGRGMTKRSKIRVISTLSLTFAIGIFFTRHTPWVWLILFIWTAHVIYFSVGTKTISEEEHAKKHQVVRFKSFDKPFTEDHLQRLKEEEGIDVTINSKKKRISVISEEGLPAERLKEIFEPLGFDVVSIQ